MKHLYIRCVLAVGRVLPVVLLFAGCHMSGGSDATNNSADLTNSPPATNQAAMNAENGVTNPVDADNSQNNAHDRNGAGLTAMDQGTTAADLNLTRQIRRLIVNSTNSYSFLARNIKIITLNGNVTLRGPVDSDAERSCIGEIAHTAAGDGSVDNQLEVKTSQ